MMKVLSAVLLVVFSFSFYGCKAISNQPIDNQTDKGKDQNKEKEVATKPTSKDANGLKGDAVFYWGTLTIEPISDRQSRIIYNGKKTPFFKEMEGMEFVSARIHKNPNVYPAQGDNYFPGLKTCRYAKVIKVESGNSLLVDFAFNGGNIQSPKKTENTDGYFFTDNRLALKTLIENKDRKEEIVLEDDKVYVVKGMPEAKLSKSILFKRSGTGKNKPILMLSIEDGFDNAANGNGRSKSFKQQFGGSDFFILPNNNNNCIFEEIDICPTIYTIPVIQKGIGYRYFWLDKEIESSQKRICSIRNSNMDAVRNMAIKELGKEHPDMTWDLPILGKCVNGGIDDGNDIVALTEYSLMNTSWRSSTVMVFKGNKKGGRAGIMFKVVGDDPKNPVQLVENLEVKKTSFENIPIKFSSVGSHTEAEILSNDFNWYMMVNQDWNGGTSTNYRTFNKIDVEVNGTTRTIHFHNNADFRELADKTQAFVSTEKANIFDAFPKKGTEITWYQSGVKTGILKKVNNQTIDVWGYQFATNDKLEIDGKEYTIKKIEYQTKDKSKTKYYIHYWRLTLDGPPIVAAKPTILVKESANEILLDGKTRNCKVYVNRDEYSHLFYTNGKVNMHLENVETYGYWRSSGGGVGKPKHMYMAATVAYFKNVVTHNKGGVGAEWVPPFFNYRMKTQGDQYRLVYDGGNMTINQTKRNDFTVLVKNRPVANGSLISPVMGDDLGMAGHEQKQVLKLVLNDGDVFSIKDLKGQAVQLSAFGKCTLMVDGYEGVYPKPDDEKLKNRMQGISILNADETTRLTIIGKGGKAPIKCTAKEIKSSNQVKIELTDWEPVGELYSNKFISFKFKENADPDFSKNVRAIGKNQKDLLQKKKKTK